MRDVRNTAFRQGWDGLCGFYAALNAVWVLFPDLRKDAALDELRLYASFKKRARQRLVFDEAIDLLSRVGGVNIRTLSGGPHIGGIDEFQVQDLLEKMRSYWRLPFTLTMLHDTEDMPLIEWLQHEQNFGTYAAVCGQDSGSHWATLYRTKAGYSVLDPSGRDDDGTINERKPDHRSGVLIRRI